MKKPMPFVYLAVVSGFYPVVDGHPCRGRRVIPLAFAKTVENTIQ